MMVKWIVVGQIKIVSSKIRIDIFQVGKSILNLPTTVDYK